jgi:ParB-like chromosome segregation protein Spo0J
MPKASRDALGAKGKTDVWMMDPEDLVLVVDGKAVLYDERVEEPYDEEFVQSIMVVVDGAPIGIIHPVTGRRDRESGKVEIVVGRGRVTGAREANKRYKRQGLPFRIRVPVWIKRVGDSHALAMLIIENEHRRPDTPLNRARKAQRYINLGHDAKEVAALFGVTAATVKDMLALLEATAVVRDAADAGRVTLRNAYKLSRLEPAEQRKKLAELLEKAPRTPGKKRSRNAAKAREVMGGGPPVAATGAGAPPASLPPNGSPTSLPSLPRVTKKIEQATADAIAGWIERNWSDRDWNGDPKSLPERIRKGEWREAQKGEEAIADGGR